jgi:hypothetical protein
MSFLKKTENRKVKQVLLGGWYHWEVGGYKDSECSGNIMYLCMEMEK